MQVWDGNSAGAGWDDVRGGKISWIPAGAGLERTKKLNLRRTLLHMYGLIVQNISWMKQQISNRSRSLYVPHTSVTLKNDYVSGQCFPTGVPRHPSRYPREPRVMTFSNISLKIHFENVIKPYSKLLRVRHCGLQTIFQGASALKMLGNTVLGV